MKKLLVMLAFALSTIVVAGCNTMEGAGEDIERGGQEIQDASE